MTQSGANLIKKFEGFQAKAYPDPLHGTKVPTIGYGTTVNEGQTYMYKGLPHLLKNGALVQK